MENIFEIPAINSDTSYRLT